MITYEDFLKIDIRVGTIISVEPNSNISKPSFILKVDFGNEIGVKKSSAQLLANYQSTDLIGLQISAVVNFPPKQIGKMISEFLILGFPDNDEQPILISPLRKVKNGGKLF
ncbi:MAG: tRNA-binding protein [Alphaproteobacteria bacterium]|jgi:tRNA-binding protein|nr:tRNA-binding protein [Alphaproteobacteria bacterium]